jgi:hypothetical protein
MCGTTHGCCLISLRERSTICRSRPFGKLFQLACCFRYFRLLSLLVTFVVAVGGLWLPLMYYCVLDGRRLTCFLHRACAYVSTYAIVVAAAAACCCLLLLLLLLRLRCCCCSLLLLAADAIVVAATAAAACSCCRCLLLLAGELRPPTDRPRDAERAAEDPPPRPPDGLV